jgi:natural product precursor
MKKKFKKKLILNKETISNLGQKQMNEIRGGTWVDVCTESCSWVNFCCDSDRAAKAKAAC